MVKHIYVSPHSDDVALSCGGQIISNALRKNDTIILNVFTSAHEQAPQGSGENGSRLFDSINADRTTEDKSAWNSIGIEAHYLNLPESLLRGRFPFALFSNREDRDLSCRLGDALIQYIEMHPGATFYFPAGFGNHVDHLACRDVAFDLLDRDLLNKIVLYEDIPYCWLKFIRDQSYKALFRQIKVDKAGLEKAFRPGGESMREYIAQKIVPFPRGRKLFPAVYASLIYNKLLGRGASAGKMYRGNIDFFELHAEEVSQKKGLLFHYGSQIPMLFGEEPERLFVKHHASLSREVTIEISKAPPAT
jgi:LmbE family N-acetylglucosaminyl deacetylase